MRFTPTIIFTKYDHLYNDFKARIKQEEEESEENMSSTEKEMRIISLSTEVISDYMKKVL
jgi:F0F1-type ATP synthase assembly protein I